MSFKEDGYSVIKKALDKSLIFFEGEEEYGEPEEEWFDDEEYWDEQ